jgi:hypothetical protein
LYVQTENENTTQELDIFSVLDKIRGNKKKWMRAHLKDAEGVPESHPPLPHYRKNRPR